MPRPSHSRLRTAADAATLGGMPQASARPVDPVGLLRHLGLAGPATAEPITGGADALLWKINFDDCRFALRVLRPGRREQAEREINCYRYLSDTAIPVPAVHATLLDGDRPAYLMDWVDGRPLADVLLDPATPEVVRHSLQIEFGRLQAMINELPGPDLPTAKDWIARRTGDSELARMHAEMDRRDRRLLHLDYHPLNVLVRGGQVVAVLDWANATLGDPRFDRARAESILTLHPDPDGQLAQLLTAAIAAWQIGYAAGSDIDPEFRRWAGAAMAEDLAGRPALTETLLTRIRAYP